MLAALEAMWRRWRDLVIEGWKYLLVSVVALAVDYGLLVALTDFARVDYRISAGVGFAVGLLVNYALSITFVFRQHRLRDRRLEFLGFFVIGLIGWGINEGVIILFVESLHFRADLAKIPATAVGFVFNFGARRLLLFSARSQASGLR
jgi:putative flippase GtrA